MASRVYLAIPPKVPLDGVGLMKAFLSLANSSIRVLSPRMEPPVIFEEGSTASTATLISFAVNILPKVSMKVDFPTPGIPVKPRRIEFPECVNKSDNNF